MKVQDVLDLLELLSSFRYELTQKAQQKNGYLNEENIEKIDRISEALKNLIAKTEIF